MINVIKASIGCLLVSLLLQLVAITTPGWQAMREDDNVGTTSITYKTFIGVFYYIICTNGECDTKPIVHDDLKGHTLQWQMVADFGNLSVVNRDSDFTVIFPWCVLVHGIGALLVSAVILADLYMLISTERRSSSSNFPSSPSRNMPMT